VAATLSGNSLRQTIHTHHASVHQAVKLVAALLSVARVTTGAWRKVLTAYRRVYDSSPAGWNPTLGNQVRATFVFFSIDYIATLTDNLDFD